MPCGIRRQSKDERINLMTRVLQRWRLHFTWSETHDGDNGSQKIVLHHILDDQAQNAAELRCVRDLM